MGVEKISKEANYMGINGYIHSLKFNEQRLPDAAVLFRHDQELRWTTVLSEFKYSPIPRLKNGIARSKGTFKIKSHLVNNSLRSLETASTGVAIR